MSEENQGRPRIHLSWPEPAQGSLEPVRGELTVDGKVLRGVRRFELVADAGEPFVVLRLEMIPRALEVDGMVLTEAGVELFKRFEADLVVETASGEVTIPSPT
jgi:hypothetical protein